MPGAGAGGCAEVDAGQEGVDSHGASRVRESSILAAREESPSVSQRTSVSHENVFEMGI